MIVVTVCSLLILYFKDLSYTNILDSITKLIITILINEDYVSYVVQ